MYLGHNAIIANIYQCARELIISKNLNVNLLVDFGARHGESFDTLGELCQGDYIFVEPVPKAADVISHIIKKRPEKRLHLLRAIVADVGGTAEMHTFERDDDQSSNVYTNRNGRYGDSKLITVDVVPYKIFDELFPGQMIDFAKVNIEGSEYKMIEDGFFHKKVNAFIFELHNEHVEGKSWKDAVDMLSDTFDITTYGDVNYKYCFMTGVRCK